MAKKVNICFDNGECIGYSIGVSLLELAKERKALYASDILAAKVNNEIVDLRSIITEDCTVDFLDLQTEAGNKVYQRSLNFVIIAAAKEIFPQAELTIEHSLSKGLYCELHLGRELTESDVTSLEAKARQIVNEDWPIIKRSMPKDQAIEILKRDGYLEKVRLLEQSNQEIVTIYKCGSAIDYFYGTLVPSAGYLKLFKLEYYRPGFIILTPRIENPHSLPEFIEQPKLASIFLEAEKWGGILGCGYVADLNEHVQKGTIGDIIRVAEALHEKKIAQIADFISQHRDTVRVILIAGPSSSGKTTFAQRLGIQLRVNDMRPVPISLDDYFVDRIHTPKDEKGDYDFEAIEAIDLNLFNDHLQRMLNGEEVEVPTYNFVKGQREYRGHKVKINKNQPLIIEGIHGLNERLTASVPKENKIKIYISALTQLSIDNHHRIPTTDTRLIRRIVRDSQFRGHDALKTLKFWPSVRRGEEKNIFPYQEQADVMFNSALIYELAVLKNYAEPLLQKISPESLQYAEAKRLLNFLSYFYPIDDAEIPYNSIIREFIGKSCFC